MLSFSNGHQLQAATEKRTTVWFIVDPKRLGDIAMSEGISIYFAPLVIDTGSKLKVEYKIAAELEASTRLPEIVFGIGDEGLNGLQKLVTRKDRNNTKLAWVAHQAYDHLYPIAAQLDLISIPGYALNAVVQQQLDNVGVNPNTVVTTLSVPHSLTVPKINAAAENWRHDISVPQLPTFEKSVLVNLGGDAEDTAKQWHKLTAKEAERFADFVSTKVDNKTTVFVVNGPRSGKFKDNDIDQIAHRSLPETHSLSLTIPTDAVTAAFLARLKTKIDAQQVFFCDFRFDQPSVYKPILSHLQNMASHLVAAFVTGDSSSMVSEMTDILPQDRVIPVTVGSMSEVHHAHIESMNKAGYSIVVPEAEGFVLKHNPASDMHSHPPAAYVIAMGLMNALRPESQTKKTVGFDLGL